MGIIASIKLQICTQHLVKNLRISIFLKQLTAESRGLFFLQQIYILNVLPGSEYLSNQKLQEGDKI